MINATRIKWELGNLQPDRFLHHWTGKRGPKIPDELFSRPKVWLEIGAGTGWFFMDAARLLPDVQFVAIERCKVRGKRLIKRTAKSGLMNMAGFRGNAVPAVLNAVPKESVDMIFILYPCPFPKNSQRKNRWYLHPVMPHIVSTLKKGGKIVWASDQKYYIDEAEYVCREVLGLKTLQHGQIQPNDLNLFHLFPKGRTKFEYTFLEAGQPCYELISEKAITS